MLTKNPELSRLLISPSVLSADFCNMGEAIKNLSKWGADMIHCDVMDGRYVPNITFGMPMVRDMAKHTKLPLDVHLMIDEPEKYVGEFCDAGAEIVTFHPDASKDVLGAIETIKSKGKKVGLAVDADKSFAEVLPYIEKADVILIMTVQAGFGGQKFKERCLRKVRKAQELKVVKNYTYDIEVDGGVNPSNAISCKRAGATIVVAGNSVFSSDNPKATIHSMWL